MILGPRSAQRPPQSLELTQHGSTVDPEVDPKCTQHGPNMDPAWTQNVHNMDPTWIPKGLRVNNPKSAPFWTLQVRRWHEGKGSAEWAEPF